MLEVAAIGCNPDRTMADESILARVGFDLDCAFDTMQTRVIPGAAVAAIAVRTSVRRGVANLPGIVAGPECRHGSPIALGIGEHGPDVDSSEGVWVTPFRLEDDFNHNVGFAWLLCLRNDAAWCHRQYCEHGSGEPREGSRRPRVCLHGSATELDWDHRLSPGLRAGKRFGPGTSRRESTP